MSDQIAETELREIEGRASGTHAMLSEPATMRLVAEIRRLPRLAMRSAANGCEYPESNQAFRTCFFCHADLELDESHEPDCAWPELEGEAEAIAKEEP